MAATWDEGSVAMTNQVKQLVMWDLYSRSHLLAGAQTPGSVWDRCDDLLRKPIGRTARDAVWQRVSRGLALQLFGPDV